MDSRFNDQLKYSPMNLASLVIITEYFYDTCILTLKPCYQDEMKNKKLKPVYKLENLQAYKLLAYSIHRIRDFFCKLVTIDVKSRFAQSLDPFNS